mgnify:CR=1 FL=1
MKKILIICAVLFFGMAQAQVAIGKAQVQGNGLLDFGSEEKGIILPVVKVETTGNYVDGTILMDSNDNILKAKTPNGWIELSYAGSLSEIKDDNMNVVTTARILNTSSEEGKGTVIGAASSTAEGVLVLESATHALILPKVQDPHINIESPVAGTIVYDTKSKTLAVFDGLVWNYWK